MNVEITTNVPAVETRLATRAAVLATQARTRPLMLGRELAAILLPELQRQAPVSEDDEDNPFSSTPRRPPGYLRDTLRATVTQARGVGGRFVAGGVVVSFTTEADYVDYVINGTAPHLIMPNTASVLVFQIGGMWIFSKAVEHPGTQPNPFHTRALSEKRGEIQAAVARAGTQIAISFR